ncbi:MAG TPA: OpgC domain-containing protein [Steroidobacteraceae bacterium]|nr:OpgC domain-containing protein [Steroidobacteraceae bacterium]
MASDPLMAAAAPDPASVRDMRLDALRGLFLVIMAAVHVPTPLSHWLHEPLGYVSAAEGFVFLGACVAGFAYGKVRRKSGSAKMTEKLRARAAKIYWVHLGLVYAAVLIAWPLASRLEPLANQFHTFLQHPAQSLLLIPSLLHQPPLFDILPLYVVFLALSPWALELAARHGWGPVLGGSALVWLIGQTLPLAPLVAAASRLLPLRLGAFNLLGWQFLWLAGLATGERLLRKPRTLQGYRRMLIWPAFAVVLAGLLCRHRYGLQPAMVPHFAFWIDKWRLGPLRVLNSVAWALLFWSWNPRPPRWLLAPTALLGRHSLAVFAFHIPLAIAATTAIYVGGYSKGLQTLIGVAVIAAMFAYALLVARMTRPRVKLLAAALLVGMASLAHAPIARAGASSWHTQLKWQHRVARMTVAANGAYVLHAADGERSIGAQTWSTRTASPLFDGLFAMAQSDLRRDSVPRIRDAAYDHGHSMACACFIAGKQWPFVWTRDLAYSTDLALWRVDPARARRSLRFKLSAVRVADAPQGLYAVQDTGSGGSWPVSTDRVAWFLGARHLLADPGFAKATYGALRSTLAQDREYSFDPATGLYRGETSFLDWREQSYPAWTANDVRFIAQSYALSTNVLHYEALRLAAQLSATRGERSASRDAEQAEALKVAINRWFWNPRTQLFMSYLGGGDPPLPVDAHDLLGTSLVIISGVATGERARRALANYPTWPAGSPVIWPEHADQPIYHNRAIWPFVSAYALLAARRVNDPARIAHELRSIMRGAAQSGSNMENFALQSLSTHVPGKLGGPVVDSRRQLWSVAGYLNMVIEGVFGLTADGRIEPKLPVALVPMLFGDRRSIALRTPRRRITLRRPAALDGNLLVASSVRTRGAVTLVRLEAITVPDLPLREDAPEFAPPTPPAPSVRRAGARLQVRSAVRGLLYVNGRLHGAIDGALALPWTPLRRCYRLTRQDAAGMESLPSAAVCAGDTAALGGSWPRAWSAPDTGTYALRLDYVNSHGPINTGITAAVKRILVQCAGRSAQALAIVMPQSRGAERSTTANFTAKRGTRCTFAIRQGFNMSFLATAAHYTGGQGGAGGPLNAADIGALLISPVSLEAAHP